MSTVVAPTDLAVKTAEIDTLHSKEAELTAKEVVLQSEIDQHRKQVGRLETQLDTIKAAGDISAGEFQKKLEECERLSSDQLQLVRAVDSVLYVRHEYFGGLTAYLFWQSGEVARLKAAEESSAKQLQEKEEECKHISAEKLELVCLRLSIAGWARTVTTAAVLCQDAELTLWKDKLATTEKESQAALSRLQADHEDKIKRTCTKASCVGIF